MSPERVRHALEKLEQCQAEAQRRIWVFYEDSRQAWETDEDAQARQGITPVPGDVVLRVRYA